MPPDGRQALHGDRTTVVTALAAVWPTVAGQAREKLANLGQIADHASGWVLAREGEPTPELAVVLEGRVAIRTRMAGRQSLTILTLEPGDVVGWSAIVPPYRATSTAISSGRVRVLSFEAPALRALLDADAEVAAELYPQVLRAVSRRLAATRMQLLDVFAQGGSERW